MTRSDPAGDEISASNDGSTGLPWPRSWPGVYALVVGSFALWVVLLVALERVYS